MALAASLRSTGVRFCRLRMVFEPPHFLSTAYSCTNYMIFQYPRESPEHLSGESAAFRSALAAMLREKQAELAQKNRQGLELA
jgi:hypothetical protein